ncbi:MAG: hypothetical protein ABIJ16_12270 [Bacteroidota bacterium]
MIGLYFISFIDRKYLEQKIAAYLKERNSMYAESLPDLEHFASLVNARKMELPVADSNKILAGLTESQVLEIRNKMAIMITYFNRQYPMVTGELLIEDYFTFLLNDYGEYKQGTPLLIRRTNKAEMIKFFDHLEYNAGQIVFGKPKVIENRETLLSGAVLSGTSDIVKDLFSGMVKAIGGKIGAAIFDSIFPGSSNDMAKMLQELQDNIRNIFREELDAQTIENLNYQICGIVSYMQETYNPLKQAGKDKPYLESILSTQNEKMYTEVMALLMGQRYRAKGIAYLIVGANTHLSIIQEMANIDPLCDDPNKSSYMTTYHMRLSDYLDSLQCAINEVNESRLKYLGNLQESTLQGAATEHWWFIDNWVKYHSPDFYNSHDCCDYKFDAKRKAQNARDQYNINTFLPTITKDLQPYKETIIAWSQIYNDKGNN